MGIKTKAQGVDWVHIARRLCIVSFSIGEFSLCNHPNIAFKIKL
jgi:hypothetical protein